MSNVTVLRAEPAADGYSYHDVVVDADGVLAQRAPLPGRWLRFGERYETSADEVPQPWTLVCRAGEVASLAGAMFALGDQNDQLLAFARWLASLDHAEQVEERRAITLDQIVDRAHRVLAETDPLRGGE